MPSFAEIQVTDEWQTLALPAQKHYTYDLPYHNWDHALAVAESVVELGNRLIVRGMHVDLGLLAVAAAWHDAGYHENHKKLGHPTKESYSARLAEDFLVREMGKPESYALEVSKAIIGTTHGIKRHGINTLLLHRADVANIGGSYEAFAPHNFALLQEARQREPALSFDEWRQRQAPFFTFTITEARGELPKIGESVGEADSFDTQAERNLRLLQHEVSEEVFAEKYARSV